MQAIIWLAKPIPTASKLIKILVCNINTENNPVMVNGEVLAGSEHDHILIAENVDNAVAFLLTHDGGDKLDGVTDIRF